MAISDWLVALEPTDPLMSLLVELEELESAEDTDDEAIERRWDQFVDAVSDHPAAIDMWRLGPEIHATVAAGLHFDPREFLWTLRARTFSCGDGGITYLEPADLRDTVQLLAGLTPEEVDRRTPAWSGANVSREEIVERALAVLELMRSAARRGVGLLRDFRA